MDVPLVSLQRHQRHIHGPGDDYAELFKDLPADVLQGVRDLPEEVRDLLPEWVKDQLPAAAPGESRGQRGD